MIEKSKAQEIAKEYYEDVYTYCLSYADCSESEAADITQEVFLIFQQKLDKLEDMNIRAWLLATAKNKVREHFRKNKKEQKLVPLNPNEAPTEDMFIYIDRYFEGIDEVSDEYIEKCKELILKSLSQKEYVLYTKVFVEKKKYRQVAEEMNLTEKAVNLRVLRLKKKIKNLVSLSLTVIGQVIIKALFL